MDTSQVTKNGCRLMGRASVAELATSGSSSARDPF